MMSDRADQKAGGFQGRRKPQAGERPVTALNTCSSFRKWAFPPISGLGGGHCLRFSGRTVWERVAEEV